MPIGYYYLTFFKILKMYDYSLCNDNDDKVTAAAIILYNKDFLFYPRLL